MPRRGTETEFELATIERLERLGYRHVHGEELDREPEQVVLADRLRGHLSRRYPDVPLETLDAAVRRFSRPEGVDTLRRNRAFHEALTRGITVELEGEDGTTEHRHLYAVDWDDPEANEFLVVNQLPVRGKNDRRPDLVVYVNGFPLAVFELKNPFAERSGVEEALNQLRHYANEIPQLFEFNEVAVASDSVETLHGVWSAPREWFTPWKSIDGFELEPGTTGSMKALIEGLFPKERFLAYVRDFVLFEIAGERLMKKGAKYHQFFAVRLAVRKTLEAFRGEGDRRIGVIWHTTGSGKSLSMVFLVGILRRRPELENPTFVIQVDRTDLDDQLHDQFVAARTLVGDVKQAASIEDLRKLLRTEGGEVVLTTIEKFQRRRGEEGFEETEHPVLSERSNVIVIADEAHRSQYGFTSGYARYLAEALPNAKRIGFTGTPISFSGADTVEVFGDYIHTYDIRQSQEDGATVPIYYMPRQVKLHLNREDIDNALEELLKTEDGAEDLERRKGRWVALATAAGASDRLEALSRDLLDHFRERTAGLAGKAMVVCMTRENCVRMAAALEAHADCPEIRVMMTGDLSRDPPEWSEAGYITTKAQRDAIKQRMIDPDDPLAMVIVCDMWLTGTDIPCLHTLYVDKPMKGHNVIQAISRVNRVFRDKPHGLIVDYIGIGDELREATNTYTAGGGRGNPAPEISDDAVPVFLECLEETRRHLPGGIDYGDWRQLSRIDLEDRYANVFGHLTEDEERRDAFLDAEHRLSRAFLLVRHLDECRPYAEEIIFFQRVRKQILKTIPGRKPDLDLERAVKDLVDDSLESEGVVDIFGVAGIETPDLSILDDEFLQTFKDRPQENLRLKLLERLVRDELQRRQRRNIVRTRGLQEMLEDTLRRYHNRLIDAAAVIRAMVEIRRRLEEDARRAEELGLSDEELAFYDAVTENAGEVYEREFLRDLVHDVVASLKKNLKVDWTEPHREQVRAGVRSAVKRVLRRRDVRPEDFDVFVESIMEQAEALYRDWPLAA